MLIRVMLIRTDAPLRFDVRAQPLRKFIISLTGVRLAGGDGHLTPIRIFVLITRKVYYARWGRPRPSAATY